MNDTLDLDVIIPEPRTVKVNGKVYEVLPLKLNEFLALQRILTSIKDRSQEELLELMGKIFDTMRPAVPQIDEMNLTMTQAFALLEFIYKQENVKQVRTDEEKKTVVSPTPSPSS